MAQLGTHAIVIGASMGGLMAARALAEHYDRVTLVERDSLPEQPEARKGVPHGRHAHGLLARGREVLEEFFPGLTDEMVAQGALRGDLVNDVYWFRGGQHLRQAPSGLIGLLVSRPRLEEHVRRRLLRHDNVAVMESCDVVGLTASQDRARVTGITVRCGDGNETLAADLVVDASGRGSRSPTWLVALGYPAPAEEKVEVGIGYMTRTYRRRPEHIGGKLAVSISASEPHWRGGVILAQEDDSWIVSLGGYLGDQPEPDEAGFLAFARSMDAPQIHATIRDAEPLSQFVAYKFPASRRLRYEAMARFPAGYLVFGDALCSFNPVYGQGMTVAATEALALRQCLREGTADLAPRFFRLARPIVDIPWSIAVGNDLGNSRVAGRRTRMMRFLNWYIGKLQFAARDNATLAETFLRVANLMAPPTSLLRPDVVLKVLRGNLRPAAGRIAPAGPIGGAEGGIHSPARE